MAFRRTFILLMSNILFIITSSAQIYEHLSDDDYRIDTTAEKALSIEVDALTFFRDNEYNSSLTKGYSLPGLWLNPKAEYNPNNKVHLELGFNAIIYEGANKYPNYAYHDISTWKGNQYQSGTHTVPWFRAQANTEHSCLVLGNIYGGSNHLLSEVMFNPEQNLSADPEMGFQALIDYKYWHFDAWINWQSYIFEEDSHQEAFTVGINTIHRWNDKYSKFHFYTPIQFLTQHRGGEQDTTSLGVQTLMNGSVGLTTRYNANMKGLNTLDLSINVLGCFQESGELWPKNKGAAFNIEASANMWKYLYVKGGIFKAPEYYVNLFGSPLFSTYNTKTDSEVFSGVSTYYIRFDYSRTYANKCTLGFNFDLFVNRLHHLNETNNSFGIYFRVNPDFVLKKFQ
jgi:hypothetical protein